MKNNDPTRYKLVRNYKKKRKWFLDITKIKKMLALQNAVLKLSRLPHAISPYGKRNFEILVVLLDEYAKKYNGKLRSYVDFKNHDACIKLYLNFAEFCDTSTLALLKEACNRAYSIDFTNKRNYIVMTIFVAYFVPVLKC